MSDAGKVEAYSIDHLGSEQPSADGNVSPCTFDLETELRFPGSEEADKLLDRFEERLSAAEAQINRVLAMLSAH